MNRTRLLVVSFVILGVAAGVMVLARRDGASVAPTLPSSAQDIVAVASDRIDPANEGRVVSVLGELQAQAAPRDDELGINADGALVLRRDVEMYQWQEQCVADACGQRAAWSARLIDSTKFREQAGHVNPAAFPFSSARFVAPGISLGAFSVAPELLENGLEARPHAVRLSELPPNLAASFLEYQGQLYAGNDPLTPTVGDLRVVYTVVPRQVVTLNGVQLGQGLVAAPAAASN